MVCWPTNKCAYWYAYARLYTLNDFYEQKGQEKINRHEGGDGGCLGGDAIIKQTIVC